MTPWQKQEFCLRLAELQCTEFVTCANPGADHQAFELALYQCGVRAFSFYPPDNTRKQAFPVEMPLAGQWNEVIIDLGSETIKIQCRYYHAKPAMQSFKDLTEYASKFIACPKEHRLSLRSGTWHKIRAIWATKKHVIIIPPVVEDE